MSTLSTHILDLTLGRPASGVSIRFESAQSDGHFHVRNQAVTDADGRVKGLVPAGEALMPGLHRLTFDTGGYFSARGEEPFYPEVVVTFRVGPKDEHYHVPLLLSRFGYSTYRGS